MTLNVLILSCIFMVNGGLHFFVPHRATKMSGPAPPLPPGKQTRPLAAPADDRHATEAARAHSAEER